MANFLECEHLTSVGGTNLETLIPRAVDDPKMRLIHEHGTTHEVQYLTSLQASAKTVDQEAPRDGVSVRYADFLKRIDVPSELGKK